jgi:hypothetical protein
MCCPLKPAPKPRTYEVSIAVQPKSQISISRIQPTPSLSTPESPSTQTISNVAHSRFVSTDQISLQSVLRSSPSSIHTLPKDEEK